MEEGISFFIRHSNFVICYDTIFIRSNHALIHQAASMKITAVKTIPLGGATHDHGWPGGTDPNVQYNTLVEVIGEDGFLGIGSCYTSRQLVEGSLQLLQPHMIGESALEPERLSEKLR